MSQPTILEALVHQNQKALARHDRQIQKIAGTMADLQHPPLPPFMEQLHEALAEANQRLRNLTYRNDELNKQLQQLRDQVDERLTAVYNHLNKHERNNLHHVHENP